MIEVEIGGWLKQPGESVLKDEPVVTLESEKATVELPAPDSGTISQILKQNGATAKVGEVIGYLEKDGQATTAKSKKSQEPAPNPEVSGQRSKADGQNREISQEPDGKAGVPKTENKVP